MTLADQLRSIKELLLTRGWTSRATACRGQLCLGGAINLVVRGDECRWPMRPNRVERECRVIRFLSEIAGIVDPGTGYELAAWNDAPDRTPEDILNLLDRAIDALLPAEVVTSRARSSHALRGGS